jgi:hypothetical protein
MPKSPRLTGPQSQIMRDFYRSKSIDVAFTKKERNAIAKKFAANRVIDETLELDRKCPAFKAYLEKVLVTKKNIQSAVFSECVYAQVLSEAFELNVFIDPVVTPVSFDKFSAEFISENALSVRYVYTNDDHTKLLVQAGGSGGVDCALIDVSNQVAFTIELKEAYSKTPEPDLPKYKDDGLLYVTEDFLAKHPQFTSMLEDSLVRNLNFFHHAGKNFNAFAPENIESAVNESYSGNKSAQVVCTEDKSGKLTMLPADQIGFWSSLQGEIRPAGKNRYEIWTRDWFIGHLESLGGKINDGIVLIDSNKLKRIKQRGGVNPSGYKIGSLFHIKSDFVEIDGTSSRFRIVDVEQLNPTIAVKMDFRSLDVNEVKSFYGVGV